MNSWEATKKKKKVLETSFVACIYSISDFYSKFIYKS